MNEEKERKRKEDYTQAEEVCTYFIINETRARENLANKIKLN